MSKKDLIQYASALFMLVSGAGLAFVSFFRAGDVTENVLFYVAQCIIYAGSVFGVSVYIKAKFDELRDNRQ